MASSQEHVQATLDAPRDILAVMVFDSLTQPFPDARGATDARQILMQAEEFDIHLKISTNPSQHQIIGQVFARTETESLSSVRVHLWLDGKLFKTTVSDNFGQFQFAEVPQGVFRLVLDLPQMTVAGGITISQQV
jgi:hypothetical protein